jgi:mRNA interferase MazF
MTTADYNADHPFAVSVGVAKGRKAGQTSYVLCHQPSPSTGVCAALRHTR